MRTGVAMYEIVERTWADKHQRNPIPLPIENAQFDTVTAVNQYIFHTLEALAKILLKSERRSIGR